MDFPDLENTSINAVFWNNFFVLIKKKHLVFDPSNSGWGTTDYTGEDQQASTWKVIKQNTSTKTTLKEKKELFFLY